MAAHPAPPPESPPAGVGPPIRLGVSTCLLGQNVRATGGHSRDAFLVATLGRWVEWVPVCPEVEMGLSVPRPTMRLVGSVEAPRLVTSKGDADLTQDMASWADGRLPQLAGEGLDGYVFKKNSPSCGLFRVRVYDANGVPSRRGRGIFAQRLTTHLPLLPVEEEGRLNDVRLRENFIERIFAHHRWRTFLESAPRAADLVRFHTAQKLTVLSHSPRRYRELGRLVADAGRRPLEEVGREYGRLFMEALGVLASPGRHANVLHHLMGFLKTHLDSDAKAEMTALVRDYREGLVPLVVPLTLLRHHLRRHPVPPWVHQQVYLSPYPRELMLRNHV